MDWWIFCASIKVDDSDLDVWKAKLNEDYAHVSKNGRATTIAQAAG